MDSSFSLTNAVAAAISFFTLLGTIFFLFFDRKSSSHQENKTMASSSPPPSPDFPQPQNRKYHVFPSFHGPDVRRTLLSHILAKFESKGIHTFVDNDMERSKPIGALLIEAIKGSRIAIVFLSKNYASSTWCLDELVEIMESREKLGQIVISLFHEVDPTDVKKQTGDFGKVFKKTCKGKTKDVITRWEKALEEVAKIAGYHSKNGSEAEMIEKFATEVSTKLNMSTPSRDFSDLVGMEAHMIKMEQHLQLDLEEVRMIGIWGPPGIGKTTLARFLFSRHCQDFQLTLFMDNIKRKYKMPAASSDDYDEKLALHKEFMSQLTNEKDIKIPSLGIAKDRLHDKKVLVVLDDVDQSVQLEAMAGETSWFGPGSRIVVTTQDEKVLKKRQIMNIYKVDLPSPDDALQMFCMSAFRQMYPKDGFQELSCEAVRIVGALPLELRVMGSYFKEMTKEDWTNELPSLMTRPNEKIKRLMKFSYDALSDGDKSLFLHIACFFNDELVDIVEGCLTNSPFFSNVTLRLRVLVEKSLISMDSGRIRMHNSLVQLGKEIVRQQSPNEPGKRQFLYDERDIEKVLSDDQAGSSSVVGIDLKKDITCTSERAFKRLSNLQFLRINCHATFMPCFPSSFPRLLSWMHFDMPRFPSSFLIVLSWRHFNMPRFPSGFHTELLVKLDMRDSNLKILWEGIQPLNNLKWLNLSGSKRLKELPDLSTATNLCELHLFGCESLKELPDLSAATNLCTLDFFQCSSLVRLHSSIGNAMNLKTLDLGFCKSLVEIPSSIENLINLESLNLYRCSKLMEISWSMENATKLRHLDFGYCESLVKLPCFIGSASNEFDLLRFQGCSSLVKLPSYIGNPVYLKELNLSFCSNLVELPSFIGNATNLETLNLIYCSSLVELPSSIQNLRKLKKFGLKGCSKLEVVLTNINLESLVILDLTACFLLKSDPEACTNIDPWIGRGSSLRQLVLTGMRNMVTLPKLPNSIEVLVADDCFSLERLDSIVVLVADIGRLNFGNCFRLNQEARDLIIQTRTSQYAVLPGQEVPVCFTYRSSGDSLTVNLNEKSFRTSTIFKACIILAGEYGDHGEYGEHSEHGRVLIEICCSMTSTQSARTAGKFEKIQLASCFSNHLYIFEVEASVTSTELFFEFDTRNRKGEKRREIKECGVYQLPDRG